MQKYILAIMLLYVVEEVKPQFDGGNIITQPLLAGKPALDLNALTTRTEALGHFATISRDGGYCSYVINGPQDYMMIQSVRNVWKHKLPGIRTGVFSGDNRYYIYQVNDSLCYLRLKEGTLTVVKEVITYQCPPNDLRNEWIAIELKNKNLLLRNLITSKEYRFSGVNSYYFTTGGGWFSCEVGKEEKNLVMVQLSTGKVRQYEHVTAHGIDQSKQVLIFQTVVGGVLGLNWVNLISGEIALVWTNSTLDSTSIGSYSVDNAGQRLVFTVQASSSRSTHMSVWYYKKGMPRAIQKKIRDTAGRIAGLELTGAPVFTDDGRYIIVSMRESKVDSRKPQPGAVQVDVWNYQDTFLMPAQLAGTDPGLNRLLGEKVYKFSMASDGSGEVTYLSGAYEDLFSTIGKYAVIQRRVWTDRFWEDWAAIEVHIICLRDGKRVRLKRGIMLTQFSPDETWLLCYDSKTGQYLRYDIGSGEYTDLSGSSGSYFGGEDEFSGTGRQPEIPRGIAGWLKEGGGLLVYDHYDIWQLDITGKKPAVNLTNGRKDKVRFEVTRSELEEGERAFYGPHARLVLTAVNMENKDNGFYALSLDSHTGPEQLCMGPYVLYLGGLSYGQTYWGRYSTGRRPLKARDADTWLLVRQSATDPPNYYISHGLREFKALTTLRPRQNYNWVQAELVSFRQQDGSNCKGIMYKPENFDPAKKYPVLIHYYDQFSMCLNQYPVLGYTSSGYINIPWFVSRGYLVFLTDIYFNKGQNGTAPMNEAKIPYGEAALNAVEGAASWLSGLPYVDSSKMGIAGHSMGGGLTSYILTHSNRFAAVFMGAGVSDWISAALQLDFKEGMSRLGITYYSGSTGSDIWTNNSKYLDNPILHVGKVTSPLLMFHCKADYGVPFEQAVELFVAMRRMGKKAWLLQYDQGVHSTLNPKDSRDLTIRVTQFFDHYLKGALAPRWMTTGVRAQLKGVESGLEADSSGRKP